MTRVPQERRGALPWLPKVRGHSVRTRSQDRFGGTSHD